MTIIFPPFDGEEKDNIKIKTKIENSWCCFHTLEVAGES